MPASSDRPRRGRGRPRLDPPERRSVGHLLRFTPEEHARVRARAKESGRPLARFMREAALGVRIVVPRGRLERAYLAEVARIGNDLRQLARADGAMLAELRPEIERSLAEVREALGRIVDELHAPQRQPVMHFPTAAGAEAAENGRSSAPEVAGDDEPDFYEPPG